MSQSADTDPRLVARAAPPATASLVAIYAAGIGAIMLWSGTAIATKIAVRGIDPTVLALMRTVAAGVILIPVGVTMRPQRPRGGRETRWLVVSALGAFLFFPFFYTLSLRYTTASHATLIMASQSIFTGLFASLADRRAPTRRWITGCCVALLGEVALVGARFGLADQGSLAGDLWGTVASLFASAGYVAGSRLAGRIGTWATTIWGNFLAGAIALTPLVWLGVAVDWSALGWSIWGAVVYISLSASVLAYILWYWALARGGVQRVSLLLFANPIFTVALAIVFLGERLSLPLVLSGLMVLAGIWLAQRR